VIRKITDTRLLAMGIVGVILAAILTVTFAPGPKPPPTSVRSSGPQGALALRLWLERIGYETRELVSKSIQPGDLDVIFALNPRTPYTEEEARHLRDWVRRGHTLIVAGSPYAVNSLLASYDVSLFYLSYDGKERSLTGPTLVIPPFERLKVGPIYGIASTRADLTMHLADGATPILVSFPEGAGIVWVCGTTRPFSNRGLMNDPASARLVLNLLAEDPPPATIGFDEAQLSAAEETRDSLYRWLTRSASGWSLLSAGALTMTFLVLRGRRFGRAIPLQEDRLLREPVEYIRAMANLLRRSGQRAYTLDHYRGQLRRALSKRYAIDPGLSDEALLKLVGSRDPTADVAALRRLLGQLAQRRVSEGELVALALDVDEWIRKLS
jgi:hypothetical protein